MRIASSFLAPSTSAGCLATTPAWAAHLRMGRPRAFPRTGEREPSTNGRGVALALWSTFGAKPHQKPPPSSVRGGGLAHCRSPRPSGRSSVGRSTPVPSGLDREHQGSGSALLSWRMQLECTLADPPRTLSMRPVLGNPPSRKWVLSWGGGCDGSFCSGVPRTGGCFGVLLQIIHS